MTSLHLQACAGPRMRGREEKVRGGVVERRERERDGESGRDKMDLLDWCQSLMSVGFATSGAMSWSL